MAQLTEVIFDHITKKGKMNKIYKYNLRIEDQQVIQMPIGAKILTVQVQKGQVQLWALVNPEIPTQARTIEIIGTGNPINDDIVGERNYIATFQLHDGSLVFHVFELDIF